MHQSQHKHSILPAAEDALPQHLKQFQFERQKGEIPCIIFICSITTVICTDLD